MERCAAIGRFIVYGLADIEGAMRQQEASTVLSNDMSGAAAGHDNGCELR